MTVDLGVPCMPRPLLPSASPTFSLLAPSPPWTVARPALMAPAAAAAPEGLPNGNCCLGCATFTVTFVFGDSPNDLRRVGVSLGSGSRWSWTRGKSPMPEYLGCTTAYLFLGDVPAGDPCLPGGSSCFESLMYEVSLDAKPGERTSVASGVERRRPDPGLLWPFLGVGVLDESSSFVEAFSDILDRFMMTASDTNVEGGGDV